MNGKRYERREADQQGVPIDDPGVGTWLKIGPKGQGKVTISVNWDAANHVTQSSAVENRQQ